MPINSTHPNYNAMLDKVARTRACYEGPDAIKEAGTAYLPKLDGQDDVKYNAYKQRGLFLPVIKPTATAFKGAIMRNDPVIEVPANIDYLVENTDDLGKDLNLTASEIIREQLIGGRCGALLEHTGDRTKILLYPFESIVNWTEDYIVLAQDYEIQDPKDKYLVTTKVEYLELTLDEAGLYIQNVWRSDGKQWVIHNTLVPTNRGARLEYIPFAVANTTEVSTTLTNPALLEVADINLDHYRLSTDLRHGLHYTALPTMFVFGDLMAPDGTTTKLTVGAGSANHITDPAGRAELLEFTGAGLGAIAKAIEEDKDAMASIGAKMLQNHTAGVKAAETARIEASGESATLSTIADACEALLTQLLTWAAEWEGGAGEVVVNLNRDFLDTSLDPQQLTALLSTWQGGGMSLDTFLYNLQRGELLPKGRDIEDEKELIAEGAEELELEEDPEEEVLIVADDQEEEING